MPYQPQNFEHLKGISGLSDRLLANHFKLYEGYVKNTNLLLEEFQKLSAEDKLSSPTFAEQKRRFGWEFNGMRLHEYFFRNITKEKTPLSEDSALYKKITEDFGSFENWEKDFKATGMMRGIGWVALYFDTQANRLINTWINEHNTGHLTNEKLLLILDAFEHAYMVDYDTNKSDYLTTIFNSINWNEIEKRFMA